MMYRVSFYRKSEVVDGRAPRYMLDIETDSIEAAKAIIIGEGFIVRSAYKTPENKPIRDVPSFVFETAEDRTNWYKQNKVSARLCTDCGKNPVERYKRICADCLAKKEFHPCSGCQKNIYPATRRYCAECTERRQGMAGQKRKDGVTIERTKEHIEWAQNKLKTETRLKCDLSAKYQGMRRPHVKGEGCRTCLQKFIDVQTVYLANLMAEEKPNDETFIKSLLEETHAHGHAAGV